MPNSTLTFGSPKICRLRVYRRIKVKRSNLEEKAVIARLTGSVAVRRRILDTIRQERKAER